MSIVPEPIAACLTAINQKSSSAFITPFTQDAILIDEGRTDKGRDAIQAWCEKALLSHNATIKIQQTITQQDRTIVKVIMDGDFVEDYGITEPFTLYFSFQIKDNKIHHLLITPWDSSRPSMKAVYLDRANANDPISTVKIAPRPQQDPPEGWVRVKIQAVGLNYHDIFTMKGHGMHPLTFPLILGCEGTGTLAEGTPVLLYPCMGSPDFKGDETLDRTRNVFSELTNGTLAEYVNVPERNIVVRPKELEVESAAVLGIAWLAAYRMLVTKSGLRAGQTMLVQGSSGGVSSALIQLGAAAGMRVLCTGRTAAKRELGLKLGAEKAFEAGQELPEKVDAAFDTSGEVTWEHSMNSVKTGGTIVTCGGHGGRTIPVDVSRVFVEQINIRGSYLGTLQEFRYLIDFVVAKSIKPHIGLVVSMDEAEVGFRKMLNGETAGKIVVRM
ncbi:NAD(P)-binding protein [Mollisia scopiformis]|uniref:NAD(P)-binding protein n=1 Tax=Mollisia scopiformis TaxID=149040 RepID=A0A194XCS6_MOLSC|nr:NAD(P)-binding protein [Mollisia scopiformis]KUJ17964.1 NAD(P)-binding protein [Mollisia scopiformis]